MCDGKRIDISKLSQQQQNDIKRYIACAEELVTLYTFLTGHRYAERDVIIDIPQAPYPPLGDDVRLPGLPWGYADGMLGGNFMTRIHQFKNAIS